MAGHICDRQRHELEKHFAARGWALYDETWLKENLLALANLGYVSGPVVMAAKLLVAQKRPI